MRRVIATVGLSLAAVVASGAVGAQSSAVQNRVRNQDQLAVRLLPPSPYTREPLRYFLNEPAYVAAFVIYPGRGVRLIYPEIGQERQQLAGYHSEPLWQANWDAEFDQVILGPPTWGPHYLYVVASRTPLGIAQYVHHPMQLAHDVGYESYRSFDSDEQFDALLNHVVSVGSDASWDADTYMLWTNPPDRALEADSYALYYPTRIVYCRSGASMIVPFNYPFAHCPGDARLVPSLPPASTVPQSASTQTTANVPAPTVLPTIRGTRKPVPVQDGRDIPAPAAAGFRTTAAGGAAVAGADGGSEAPAPTVTIIRDRPIIVAPGGLYDREELHRGRRDIERGDRTQGPVNLPPRTGPVMAQPPRMAPAPQLPPPPRMSPAPQPAQAPRMAPAPQAERPIMREPVVRVDAPPRPAASPAPQAAPAEPHKQQ